MKLDKHKLKELLKSQKAELKENYSKISDKVYDIMRMLEIHTFCGRSGAVLGSRFFWQKKLVNEINQTAFDISETDEIYYQLTEIEKILNIRKDENGKI